MKHAKKTENKLLEEEIKNFIEGLYDPQEEFADDDYHLGFCEGYEKALGFLNICNIESAYASTKAENTIDRLAYRIQADYAKSLHNTLQRQYAKDVLTILSIKAQKP